MTPRQKEFCRHYLRGKSAVQAAIAAGYAKSTAEHNASDMLRSEQVHRYLEARRFAARLFTRQDLEETAQMLRELRQDENPRIRVAAGRELRQLARQAFDLLIDQPDEPRLYAQPLPQSQPQSSSNRIEAEEADSEPLTAEEKSLPLSIEIPETEPEKPQVKDNSAAELIELTRLLTQNRNNQEKALFRQLCDQDRKDNQALKPAANPPPALKALSLPRHPLSTPARPHPPTSGYTETRMANGRACRAHHPA